MRLDPNTFEALTFDCYGTLIDWEAGIIAALRPLLLKHDRDLSDSEILQLFSEFEPQAQSGGYKTYRSVLRMVTYDFASRLGFGLDEGDDRALVQSVADWPAFADTGEALAALQNRFRIGILSNIDNDLFGLSEPRLGIKPDIVVTAEDVGSYKPAHGHFEEALKRLSLPKEKVLHVGQSLFHDIRPANELGFTCVHVRRESVKGRAQAAKAADATPDASVADLSELAGLLS